MTEKSASVADFVSNILSFFKRKKHFPYKVVLAMIAAFKVEPVLCLLYYFNLNNFETKVRPVPDFR